MHDDFVENQMRRSANWEKTKADESGRAAISTGDSGAEGTYSGSPAVESMQEILKHSTCGPPASEEEVEDSYRCP